MKLALFQPTRPGAKPFAGDELVEKYNDDCIRVSEYVEVEFQPLSIEARRSQLERLEAAREKARQFYEAELARINVQAEVLA